MGLASAPVILRDKMQNTVALYTTDHKHTSIHTPYCVFASVVSEGSAFTQHTVQMPKYSLREVMLGDVSLSVHVKI